MPRIDFPIELGEVDQVGLPAVSILLGPGTGPVLMAFCEPVWLGAEDSWDNVGAREEASVGISRVDEATDMTGATADELDATTTGRTGAAVDELGAAMTGG